MAETEQSIALRLEEMIEVQNRINRTIELLIRQVADLNARLDGDREDVAAATIQDLREHEFDWQVDELGRNGRSGRERMKRAICSAKPMTRPTWNSRSGLSERCNSTLLCGM